MTVGVLPWRRPLSSEALGEDAGAAGVLIILGDELAAGLEVADEGRLLADGVEVVDGEGDVEFVGDGDEVEDGVGAAAGCADGGDGVFEGLAGDDLRGLEAGAGEVHDELAGLLAGGVLFGGHGGDAGELDGRDAEELAGHGHGVGGELAAAGAGAGAGGGFDGFELGVGDLAGGVGADGFEDLLDGDLSSSPFSMSVLSGRRNGSCRRCRLAGGRGRWSRRRA